MATNATFYTDSNGREMLKRVLNQRPTYKTQLEEPIAGNYYPVSTRIMLKDDKSHFSIITDRSQGGTSLRDGEMELMTKDVTFVASQGSILSPDLRVVAYESLLKSVVPEETALVRYTNNVVAFIIAGYLKQT
ncbi:carbohydrate binding [Homalodisca vitripennis]|nr:carbohydrate binding [Homalodisca vitripennis]